MTSVPSVISVTSVASVNSVISVIPVTSVTSATSVTSVYVVIPHTLSSWYTANIQAHTHNYIAHTILDANTPLLPIQWIPLLLAACLILGGVYCLMCLSCVSPAALSFCTQMMFAWSWAVCTVSCVLAAFLQQHIHFAPEWCLHQTPQQRNRFHRLLDLRQWNFFRQCWFCFPPNTPPEESPSSWLLAWSWTVCSLLLSASSAGFVFHRKSHLRNCFPLHRLLDLRQRNYLQAACWFCFPPNIWSYKVNI